MTGPIRSAFAWTIFAILLLGPAATMAQVMETAAKHAIILDDTTGTVLFEKLPDEQLYPASMSKLMTAYVVFELLRDGRLKLEDKLPVSEKAWRMGGSKTFVEVNTMVSVDDLLRGVIIQSGNDACIVLAEGISGTEEAFAELMNRRGQAIGLTGTHLMNATGWPDPQHVTTARDLATIAKRIIDEFPEYYPLFSEQEFTFNGITQRNRNPLLDIGADGLKTGHTEEAGYGLTASAIRDGRRIIMVLHGLTGAKQRAEEAKRLLEWSFRAFENVTIARAGQVIDDAPVWLGEKETVPIVVGADLVVTVPRGALQTMRAVARFEGPIPAPIAAGQPIGTLIITLDGGGTLEVPLQAGADVAETDTIGRVMKALGELVPLGG